MIASEHPSKKIMITFQMSTHYLPKIALRLEVLFIRIKNASVEINTNAHHFALLSTLEMMKLIEKPELKSRFLKEFIRLEYVFNKAKVESFNDLLQDLQANIQTLSHHPGRLGVHLFHDPLLQSIRLSQSHLHHDIEVDSPELLFWLENTVENRQTQIKTWIEALLPLYRIVAFYLTMLRESAEFITVNSHHGFYQQYIADKKACYFILVRFSKTLNLIPKIQIGHHGINIRFCDPLTMKEKHDVEAQFELAMSPLG